MDHNHETRIYWVPASYMETLKFIGHIPSEIIFKIPLLLHPGHANSLSNLITRRPTSQLQCSFLRVHCRGHKVSIRCKSETPWIDNINCTRSKNLQGRCKCFSRDEVLRWNQKGGLHSTSRHSEFRIILRIWSRLSIFHYVIWLGQSAGLKSCSARAS